MWLAPRDFQALKLEEDAHSDWFWGLGVLDRALFLTSLLSSPELVQ